MRNESTISAFWGGTLGHAPSWYKLAILAFLIINPTILWAFGPQAMTAILVAEFIFTLAMALKCYPLVPGGMITLQAVFLGLTTPDSIFNEISLNLPVILLLIMMVPAISLHRELLFFVFTKLLLRVRSKVLLGFMFCAAGALLSAFLDALTVIAIVLQVGLGFYTVYHRAASGRGHGDHHDHSRDDAVHASHHADLEQFRGFLRDLTMHAAVGTTLGGVMTLVGEPQNLLIGKIMGWEFWHFFQVMLPVTLPTLVVGLLTCLALEWTPIGKAFDYGYQLPDSIRQILAKKDQDDTESRTKRDTLKLILQAVTASLIVIGLATHVAEVGLIGLGIYITVAFFTGVTEEHAIADSFKDPMPFVLLLATFFGVVAIIHDQHLFKPVVDWALSLDGRHQLMAFFGLSGSLSSVSDNVFVATILIKEAKAAFDSGLISREQFDLLGVAINTGTNIPSIATPNGQAAFLFILTSAFAPMIRLSYLKMLWKAVPYTITMTTAAFLAIKYLL